MRQQHADAFQQDPEVQVLLGNLVAAGVGLTLTAGTHVVFNDLDWVPANHWQAEDRIYRIGQTRPAFVTYLVAEGTLDDYVAALLEQKARLVGVLEAEAADNATIVDAVVQAAMTGQRPDWTTLGIRQAERVASATDGSSMGLLGDMLDLLARAGRGLSSLEPDERIIEIAPVGRGPARSIRSGSTAAWQPATARGSDIAVTARTCGKPPSGSRPSLADGRTFAGSASGRTSNGIRRTTRGADPRRPGRSRGGPGAADVRRHRVHGTRQHVRRGRP